MPHELSKSTTSEDKSLAFTRRLFSLHRRRILIVVSLTGLCLSLLLGWVFSKRERQLLDMQFHVCAHNRVQAIEAALADRFSTLKFMSSFYAGSEEVERHEFRAFMEPILSENADIEFVAWLPKVDEIQRSEFENQMRADGFDEARIREFDSAGKLREAGRRNEYHPVMFVEPQKTNHPWIGFDPAADESARTAIERVTATKSPTIATCKWPHADSVPERRLCLFEYAHSTPPNRDEGSIGRRLDTGVLISAIRLRTLVEKVISPMPVVGVNMYFYEESAPEKTSLLLARPSRTAKHPLSILEHPPEKTAGAECGFRMFVADRTWLVYCVPDEFYFENNARWMSWTAILIGLILTAITSGFSYLLIGRTEQVEFLADQRTEALRASEERFRRLVDGAGDAFFLFDNKGKFYDVNRCACESLGYAREELLGMTVEDVQMKPLRRDDGEPYWKSSALGQPTTYEGVHRRKNGDIFPVEIRFTYLRYAGKEWCLALARDITERKQAELALQAEQRLLRQLLDLQENDRKLVAYEIHDGLAQLLTGLVMHLQTMQALREQGNAETSEMLSKALELSRQCMMEARHLIGGLRPPILDESGVVAAIEFMIEDKQRSEKAKIEFYHEVQFYHLAAPLESAIYRIVQECLTNACRYSQSEKIEIELKQNDGMLVLRIQDWGIGFDPQHVKGQHFGLRGIRERARLLSGKAEIISAPNEGTTIIVHLPLIESSLEGSQEEDEE
jgi:PAS domain S-box-containing protein